LPGEVDVGTWVGVEDAGVVALVRVVLAGDDVDSSDGDPVRVLVRVGEVVAGDTVVARGVGVDATVAAPSAGGALRPRDEQSPRCFCAIHAGAPRAIASSGHVPR
jgi:hypothetical protein